MCIRDRPKRIKEPEDLASKLNEQIRNAQEQLAEATARLETAVRENLLERTDAQVEAADRELLRATEWHRIHRKLNHASAHVTDGEYQSGKHWTGMSSREKLILKTLPHRSSKYCSVCQEAKFKRDPTHPIFQDDDKVRLAGQVTHADLCGPFPEGNDGEKYMFTFTDAASGKMWVYPIKSKSQTHTSAALKEWRRDVRAEKVIVRKGYKIHKPVTLITDRGGEFTENIDKGQKPCLFHRTCVKLKIIQKFTSAYTSAHNGRAERTNRTIAEGTRCALADSGFDWTFWPDAARPVSYTHLRAHET